MVSARNLFWMLSGIYFLSTVRRKMEYTGKRKEKKKPDVIESVCKLLELRSIERLLNTLKLHPWRIYSGSLGL